MDGIKFVASWVAIWACSLIVCGLVLKLTYNVFMLGWNLL
ncbi:hypothetical protein UFOVP33_32 [uncultured Caudovirales phage]|uniref:Uncharacterized protein n=1 Tax=uncultured Caudovirales phage TaxID=2100421 RepID=A0A6J5KP28_9CAUD|nr:hypothetical protein UFOVP33_32 [uncultured Caudovirales phage]